MRSIDINAIFEKDANNRYTDDSLLYQDILHYSTISGTFKFRELANWLVRNNNAIRSYYDATSSKKNTNYNARVHGQSTGIQNKLDHLIKLKLIYIVGPIKSEKNPLDTKLYSYTKSAHLLAWLILIKDKEERIANEISYGQKHFRATSKKELYYGAEVQHVLYLIDSLYHINNPLTILFATKFLECSENGIFGEIITRFMTRTLPDSTVSNGEDLLSLFLGFSKTLHWFMCAPQLFRETINEFDEGTKKLILFRLKMEIEEFYNDNRHLNEIFEQMYSPELKIEGRQKYQYLVSVPGREWQEMRLNNSSDYSKITVPGFCSICRSEQPYLVDIFTYLDSILAAHGPYPCRGIFDSCNKCVKQLGMSTSLVTLPYLGNW